MTKFSPPQTRRRVVLLALLLDAALGDPPNRLHPVAWMGSGITLIEKRAPRHGHLLYGGVIAFGGCGLVYGLTRFFESLIKKMPPWVRLTLRALALKMTFSASGLARAAEEVEAALAGGHLPEARRALSWHLVSRDTSLLNESEVAAATIESLAENTSDGIIAPLLYYALGGLPLAYAYRFTNTADAMLGYHDAEHEWLGKIPARTDDLLNLLPARLTALLLIIVSGEVRARHIWRRDAALTASPNAGHPMSAMAGALGVVLEKTNTYKLGAGLCLPSYADIARGRGLMWRCILFFSFILTLLPNHDTHSSTT
jgi:adenosylcobinamide-phosphate synthase